MVELDILLFNEMVNTEKFDEKFKKLESDLDKKIKNAPGAILFNKFRYPLDYTNGNFSIHLCGSYLGKAFSINLKKRIEFYDAVEHNPIECKLSLKIDNNAEASYSFFDFFGEYSSKIKDVLKDKTI